MKRREKQLQPMIIHEQILSTSSLCFDPKLLCIGLSIIALIIQRLSRISLSLSHKHFLLIFHFTYVQTRLYEHTFPYLILAIIKFSHIKVLLPFPLERSMNLFPKNVSLLLLLLYQFLEI